MSSEFKKIKQENLTRYVLESVSSGAAGAGAVASVSSPIGGVRRRDSLIAQEADTISVPVTQKPRQGPLRPQTGAGQHRDKKKEQKQGKEKHKKPFMEDHEIEMASGELQAIAKNAVKLLQLVRQYSEKDGLEAWQQSKITKAADYLNSVLQNLDAEQQPVEDHSTMSQGYGRESGSTGQAFAGRMKGAIPEDAYFQDLLSMLEEKVRLDPKCWKGKKIGSPKTKMKGGVRVNNCVPAEGVAEGSQRVDSLVTDALKIMRGSSIDDAVQALKTVLGDREFNSRRGFYNFYIRQLLDMYGQKQGVAEDDISELKKPSGSMFLKFRLKRLPDDEQMILAYGGFGTTPGDVTVGNAKIKPFSADEPADAIKRIREILQDKEFIGVGKIMLDIPKALMSPLSDVLDYAERDERLDIYSGEEGEEPETTGGKSVGYMIDPVTGERKKIDRSRPQTQVGGSSRGVSSTGMVTIKAGNDGQNLIQGLLSQGRLSRDTKVQGGRITLRQDDYKKMLDVLGNERFQRFFTKVDSVNEDWQKVNRKDKTAGMSRKAVKAYRREHPGSKLQTAVTTKPSKLKKGSKSAKRRKSFCARMKGMKKAHAGAKTKRNPNSPINKALRRWNCHEDSYMNSLAVQVAEKLNPAAPVDTWVKDFQKADPQRYHQFKNKTPQKKAQMATAAHYAANEPSKKK